MSMILAQIRDYFAGRLPGGVNLDVSENTQLRNDLGLDSLRMVDVLVNVEELFNITFDESELDPGNLHQVGDLVALIERTISKE